MHPPLSLLLVLVAAFVCCLKCADAGPYPGAMQMRHANGTEVTLGVVGVTYSPERGMLYMMEKDVPACIAVNATTMEIVFYYVENIIKQYAGGIGADILGTYPNELIVCSYVEFAQGFYNRIRAVAHSPSFGPPDLLPIFPTSAWFTSASTGSILSSSRDGLMMYQLNPSWGALNANNSVLLVVASFDTFDAQGVYVDNANSRTYIGPLIVTDEPDLTPPYRFTSWTTAGSDKVSVFSATMDGASSVRNFICTASEYSPNGCGVEPFFGNETYSSGNGNYVAGTTIIEDGYMYTVLTGMSPNPYGPILFYFILYLYLKSNLCLGVILLTRATFTTLPFYVKVITKRTARTFHLHGVRPGAHFDGHRFQRRGPVCAHRDDRPGRPLQHPRGNSRPGGGFFDPSVFRGDHGRPDPGEKVPRHGGRIP